MNDLDAGDVYRLRALGVKAEFVPGKVSRERLLAACLEAMFVVARERRAAAASASRWRRRFWLCAAVSAAELVVIALVRGGWL